MKNILVIAPHADDEILGVGATMCKHVARGDHVFVLIATNATKGAPELYNEGATKKIRSSALRAHAIIGVDKTHFLDLPAPALNSFPSYKISLAFSEIFQTVQPEILYLPHHGDLHEDHKAVYRAALVCARPQGENFVKEIYCYETLSETNWAPFQGDHSFKPNVFVVVDDFLSRKLQAMEEYTSELRDFPHCRSLEALSALAKVRGSSVGQYACEAFELERRVLI